MIPPPHTPRPQLYSELQIHLLALFLTGVALLVLGVGGLFIAGSQLPAWVLQVYCAVSVVYSGYMYYFVVMGYRTSNEVLNAPTEEFLGKNPSDEGVYEIGIRGRHLVARRRPDLE